MDELKDAESKLNVLVREEAEIDEILIPKALESFDANELARLDLRKDTIRRDAWARKAQILKLRISEREQERQKNKNELDALRPQLAAAAQEWQRCKDLELAAADAHAQLKFREYVVQDNETTIREDINALKKQLGELVSDFRGTKNGNSAKGIGG